MTFSFADTYQADFKGENHSKMTTFCSFPIACNKFMFLHYFKLNVFHAKYCEVLKTGN